MHRAGRDTKERGAPNPFCTERPKGCESQGGQISGSYCPRLNKRKDLQLQLCRAKMRTDAAPSAGTPSVVRRIIVPRFVDLSNVAGVFPFSSFNFLTHFFLAVSTYA
jgi:hypothetical protein